MLETMFQFGCAIDLLAALAAIWIILNERGLPKQWVELFVIVFITFPIVSIVFCIATYERGASETYERFYNLVEWLQARPAKEV